MGPGVRLIHKAAHRGHLPWYSSILGLVAMANKSARNRTRRVTSGDHGKFAKAEKHLSALGRKGTLASPRPACLGAGHLSKKTDAFSYCELGMPISQQLTLVGQ